MEDFIIVSMALDWQVAITGLVAGVSLFIPPLCRAQVYTIATVAGGAIPLQPGIGDGGPATNAVLALPGRVALDGAGSLYIADTGNNVIRKVTPDGTITTIAGDAINQQLGFSGDGGAAISALLSVPSGVAIDSAGNVYIADFGNNRIRMVSSSGVITTVAGGGAILGGDGPATGVRLVNPTDLAVDANNNLYFAERGLDVIRKVTPDGTITTVAGGGSSLGNGGPATSANLDPVGVTVDAGGNLYIPDASNQVFEVTPDGTIAIVAGNGSQSFSGDGGPATGAALNGPSGVAVDAAQNIYISDTGNNRIRLVTPDGTINTIAGNGSSAFSGDGGPALGAGLSPVGLALGRGGVVYVGDNGFSDRVRLLSPSSGP
jgi:hypothetical protein